MSTCSQLLPAPHTRTMRCLCVRRPRGHQLPRHQGAACVILPCMRACMLVHMPAIVQCPLAAFEACAPRLPYTPTSVRVQGASEVKVTLLDQSTYNAKVVGFDPDKDVAVLQLVMAPDKAAQVRAAGPDGSAASCCWLGCRMPCAQKRLAALGALSLAIRPC